MNSLEKAISIALQAHKGQIQRNGEPYILHPLYVMQQVDGEVMRTAAILHDVIEDSAYSLEDLEKEGFSEEVLRLVDALTRRRDESYEDYIMRVSKTPEAIPIKMADLKHNMDALRLVEFSNRDGDRMKRYHNAYRTLEKYRRSPAL